MKLVGHLDELGIIHYAERRFRDERPDLCRDLFGRHSVSHLVHIWKPQGESLTMEQACSTIDEALVLLKAREFQRSRTAAKVLSGLVLARVLSRTGFGDTRGVKRLWLWGPSQESRSELEKSKINVAKAMGRLKWMVDVASLAPGASVRIRFSEKRGRGDSPYMLELDFADEKGRFEPLPAGKAARFFNRSFTEDECATYLAIYLSRMAGAVSGATTLGAGLLDHEHLRTALANPNWPGRLSIKLLDSRSAAGDSDYGRDVAAKWETLARRSSLLRVGYHSDDQFRATIISFPDGRLFVQDEGKLYSEVMPVESTHRFVRAAIPGSQGKKGQGGLGGSADLVAVRPRAINSE